MKSIQHDSGDIGIGLFQGLTQQFMLRHLEDMIVSYLDDHEVIAYTHINMIWHRRMTEEIKRRLHGVTVYIWPAADTAPERTKGRMGHCALKTYTGGDDGRGVYVSFYPGDCKGQRHPNCYKTVAHFHKWNQDDKTRAKSVDLYGLQASQINQLFHSLHDSKLNAIFPWRVNYNCSDVIISLLGRGGIFRKNQCRQYGWKTIAILSILASHIGSTQIDYLFMNYATSNANRFRPLGVAGIILSIFKINKHSGFSTTVHTITDALLGSICASGTMYFYSLAASHKDHKHYDYKATARQHAYIAGAVGITEYLFCRGLRVGLESYGYDPPGLFPGEIIGEAGHQISGIFQKAIPKDILFFVGKKVTTLTILAAPIFFFTFGSAIKFFHDTTNTPADVLKLAENSNKNQKEETKSSGFFKILKTNKYKIMSASVLLLSYGLFAYKYIPTPRQQHVKRIINIGKTLVESRKILERHYQFVRDNAELLKSLNIPLEPSLIQSPKK